MNILSWYAQSYFVILLEFRAYSDEIIFGCSSIAEHTEMTAGTNTKTSHQMEKLSSGEFYSEKINLLVEKMTNCNAESSALTNETRFFHISSSTPALSDSHLSVPNSIGDNSRPRSRTCGEELLPPLSPQFRPRLSSVTPTK